MIEIKIGTNDAQFCDEDGQLDNDLVKRYTISILRNIIQRIYDGESLGPIMSSNGNKIGNWDLGL